MGAVPTKTPAASPTISRALVDRTYRPRRDPQQTDRAAALVDKSIADFSRLFDVGFEGIGRSQADMIRQVQQVVFLRGTVRLHSALRIIFENKTGDFTYHRLSPIHRRSPIEWLDIYNAHKRIIALTKPARRGLVPIPLDVVFSTPGNGKIFWVVFQFLTLPDKFNMSLVSSGSIAALNSRVEWRALTMLAWIGNTYRDWYDTHIEVLLETLRYLDDQHSRQKPSHVEFLDAGQRAMKCKIDQILPLSDDERAYWRTHFYGHTLSAQRRLLALTNTRYFGAILTDHFNRMAKFAL